MLWGKKIHNWQTCIFLVPILFEHMNMQLSTENPVWQIQILYCFKSVLSKLCLTTVLTCSASCEHWVENPGLSIWLFLQHHKPWRLKVLPSSSVSSNVTRSDLDLRCFKADWEAIFPVSQAVQWFSICKADVSVFKLASTWKPGSTFFSHRTMCCREINSIYCEWF